MNLKFSNNPICPDDGSKLNQRIEAMGILPGEATMTSTSTGRQTATCPACGRRWQLRSVLEWTEEDV